MTDLRTRLLPSFDGAMLAVHDTGEGPAVLLLHGLFSSAEVNWIKFGAAAAIAARGLRVIMPDFRGHGQSAKPVESAGWPPDVLIRDTLHLIEALELGPGLMLGGFSLGARTAARLVSGGLPVASLVLAGMGLEGLTQWSRRRAFFEEAIALRDSVRPRDRHYFAVQFMRTQGIDPMMALHLLASIADEGAPDLAAIRVPTLVLCGADDHDNGSPQALHDALPDAQLRLIEGTHMSSVTRPGFGAALAKWFAAAAV